MPITRRHFELGIDTEIEKWMRWVYEFLSSHKEKAFTEGEIVAALPVRNETLFIGALQKLLELGVVSARKVGEYSYYALGERKLQEYLEGQEPRRPTTPF